MFRTKRQKTNRLRCCRAAFTYFATLSWIWHALSDTTKGRQIHSAVGVCMEIFMHDDLRKRFNELAREAMERNDHAQAKP